MGTSQSSSGAPSGVPLVPPWVGPPPGAPPPLPGGGGPAGPLPPPEPIVASAPIPAVQAGPAVALAPKGRLSGARSNVGKFARSGRRAQLGRSLGHYVRTGYGGRASAGRRFAGTAATAVGLSSVLTRLQAAGREAAATRDGVLLAGRSADEVIDAVVDAVRAVDGTQDAEVNRKSIREALSETLTRYPDADLLDLSDVERSYVIETYTAFDVYHQFALDVETTVLDKARTPDIALQRMKEIQDYIRETVAAAFEGLRRGGAAPSSAKIGATVSSALDETFRVFESYLE